MEGQLKEKWYDFVSRCTMHGVQRSQCRELSFIRRGVWSVMLLACVSVVLGSVYVIIYDLVSNKVSTITEVDIDRHKEFPAITVCNMNQMKRSYVVDHLEARLYLEQIYPFAKRAIFNSSEQEEEARKIDLDDVNIRTMLSNAAHGLKETLQWATIYPGWINYLQNNVSEIFEESLTSHGLCFTLNTTWNVTEEGVNGGFQLIMDVQPDDYFASLANSISVGAVISVHHKDEPANLKGPAITVSPGSTVKAAITRTQFLHAPLLGCRENLVPSGLDHYTVYSRPACMLECEQKMIYHRCNCTYFYYNDSTTKICRWFSEYECAKEIDTSPACAQKCPDVCMEGGYDVQLSYSEYPAKNILEDYWNMDMPTDRNAKWLSLVVHYQTLRTVKVTQFKAFTIQNFASNLGGILGLFLGSSILTIMELIELLVEWIVVCLTHKRKKKAFERRKSDGEIPNIPAVPQTAQH